LNVSFGPNSDFIVLIVAKGHFVSTSVHHTIVTRWILGCIIALALILVGVGSMLLLDNGESDEAMAFRPLENLPETTQTPSPISRWMVIEDVHQDWSDFVPSTDNEMVDKAMQYFGHVALGPANASVTIVEVGTYGCSSCRKVHQEGLVEKLLAIYPDQVRYVFVIWPVIHQNDLIAAEAMVCALDQGSRIFWAYHDALFDLTNDQFDQYTTYNRYTSMAEYIEGIDLDVFNTCMVDGRYRSFVDDLLQVGLYMDLKGTPTFFVNGEITYAYQLADRVMDLLDDTYSTQEQP
jgi:protein-disulfide isomerase